MPSNEAEFKSKKAPTIQISAESTATAALDVNKKEPPITVTSGKPVEIQLEPDESGGVEFTIGTGVAPGETYNGPYTVTPSKQTQILQTRNLTLTGNITVNPIPQNYGLITWNGAFLTVS